MRASLHRYNTREDGFTLIELLIVVLIIGILAAIAIPVYLGLQNQAKNNSNRQDVNSVVHSMQVAVTEGQAVGDAATANTDTANRGDGNKVVVMLQADNKNYTVTGTQKDTGATYTYDSLTGKFSDGSGELALGGGGNTSAPLITSTKPTATGTVGTSYSYTVIASGTPTPTFTATGLPTGVTIGTTGLISGSPTAAGTYNYVITATNGTSPDATQSGQITIAAAPAINATLEPGNTYNTYFKNDANAPATQNPTTAQAHGGQYSVQVPTSQYGGNQIRFFPNGALTYGTAYTMSMWVYIQNATGTVAATTVNSSNQAYANYTIPVDSTTIGKWTRVTLQAVPADGSAYVRLYASGTSTIYVDDLTYTAN